jgi:DNA replication protein DnaC
MQDLAEILRNNRKTTPRTNTQISLSARLSSAQSPAPSGPSAGKYGEQNVDNQSLHDGQAGPGDRTSQNGVPGKPKHPPGASAGPGNAGKTERRGLRPQPEPEAVCPICGGTGYVALDVPVGHPDFGKAVPCRCKAEEMAFRRSRLLKNLSNLGGLARLTFELFIPEPTWLPAQRKHSVRRAYEQCLAFAQGPEGWLVITGTYGCGKTHLAAAIANARLASEEPAIFVVVPDLLDHLRSTFGPHSETRYDDLFDKVRSAAVLVLDDLGTQSSTPWAQEKLFQIINHRYNAQLPTVITTNQRLEDLDPRLRSRLQDTNLINRVHINAPDFRAGSNPSQSELSTLGLHRDQFFDNFNLNRRELERGERANLKNVFDAVLEYAQSPQGWLVLMGSSGSGKTHLAAAVANYQAEQDQSDAMFVVVPDLLDHLRATFSPTSTTSYDRRFDEIKKAPLLVLDDLGIESATPWAKEKLFQLLNYRHTAVLPTVITTNVPPDEMEPWLRTRILDVQRSTVCSLKVPSYRGSQSQQIVAGRGRRK